LVEMLRARAILLPRLNTIERVCAEAVTRANRLIYKQLSSGLTADQLGRLDHLLTHKEDSSLTWLGWLRQSPLKPNSRHILEHIERLQLWRALNLPSGIGLEVHQNRLLKIAREGGQMTSGDLMKFERERRYATLVAPEDFDFLYRIGEGYATVRRYAPELLSTLVLHAAPAAKPVLDAIELLREMNSGNARKLPDDAPLDFIRERWSKLIFTDAGVDRRYYELCALSELKNALRSGDIWVDGSRQFKNFNEYLVPAQKFAALKEADELPLAIDSDCEHYFQTRLQNTAPATPNNVSHPSQSSQKQPGPTKPTNKRELFQQTPKAITGSRVVDALA